MTVPSTDTRSPLMDNWVALLEESIRRVDLRRIRRLRRRRRRRGSARGPDQYVAAHPKDSLGIHGYDLAEFGLDPERLGERFSDYATRYDVPEERRGS